MSSTSFDFKKYKHEVSERISSVRELAKYVGENRVNRFDGLAAIHDSLLRMHATSKDFLKNESENLCVLIISDNQEIFEKLFDKSFLRTGTLLSLDDLNFTVLKKEQFKFYLCSLTEPGPKLAFQFGRMSALLHYNLVLTFGSDLQTTKNYHNFPSAVIETNNSAGSSYKLGLVEDGIDPSLIRKLKTFEDFICKIC